MNKREKGNLNYKTNLSLNYTIINNYYNEEYNHSFLKGMKERKGRSVYKKLNSNEPTIYLNIIKY